MNHQINISAPESLSFAWAKFKQNWKTLTLITLIMFVVGVLFGFVQEVVSAPYSNEAGMLLEGTPIWVYVSVAALTILNVIVSVVFGYNTIKIILDILDNKSVQVGQIFASIDGKFWRWLGVSILVGLMVLAIFAVGAALAWTIHWAAALLVVPLVIYIAIRYFFASYLVVDGKENTVSSAMRTAARMSLGIEWQLIGFGVMMFVIGIAIILAGVVALLIGLIPAIIIVSWLSPIATTHMYRSVYAQKVSLSSGQTEARLEA